MPHKKILFIDRDGTIIKETEDEGQIVLRNYLIQ
jgi:histidinol phosphatase-like enzyme